MQMPKPKKQKYDYDPLPEEYIDFDEDGTLLDEDSSDVLDQDEVESLDELQDEEEYKEEDGYGGGVEGIYNWDEWN